MKPPKVPQNPIERRVWIKSQLELHKSSFSAIARENGVSVAAVQSAVTRPYPKMQRLIASKLGLPPETIWPERYAA